MFVNPLYQKHSPRPSHGNDARPHAHLEGPVWHRESLQLPEGEEPRPDLREGEIAAALEGATQAGSSSIEHRLARDRVAIFPRPSCLQTLRHSPATSAADARNACLQSLWRRWRAAGCPFCRRRTRRSPLVPGLRRPPPRRPGRRVRLGRRRSPALAWPTVCPRRQQLILTRHPRARP